MRDKHSVFSAAKAAVCLSLLVASAYIVIPLPPSGLSLMTVTVSLMGLILTPLQSALAMTAYLLMGLIGLPVFQGGTAGAGKLFGVTGGYYFGFVFAVILISLLKGNAPKFSRYLALTALVAIPTEHLCAVLMMCVHNGFDIKGAFVSISLPFILGDIIKAVISAFLGFEINKAMIKNKM